MPDPLMSLSVFGTGLLGNILLCICWATVRKKALEPDANSLCRRSLLCTPRVVEDEAAPLCPKSASGSELDARCATRAVRAVLCCAIAWSTGSAGPDEFIQFDGSCWGSSATAWVCRPGKGGTALTFGGGPTIFAASATEAKRGVPRRPPPPIVEITAGTFAEAPKP